MVPFCNAGLRVFILVHSRESYFYYTGESFFGCFVFILLKTIFPPLCLCMTMPDTVHNFCWWWWWWWLSFRGGGGGNVVL